MAFNPLKGVALITGAASGIGAATVRAFIRAGVTRMSIADVQDDKLAALKDEFKNKIDIEAIVCNVADEAAVKNMVSTTVNKFGRIDYAVNCAGVAGNPAKIANISNEEYNRTVGINQNGVFFCLREQIAQMDKQEFTVGDEAEPRHQRGSIVNITSIAGLIGVAALPAYTASKHAVIGLTKTAALDYAARGIRINGIAPGYIDTPMTAQFKGEEAKALMPPIPIKRVGRPEEIADVVVFLASPASSYMVGTTVTVDGGLTII